MNQTSFRNSTMDSDDLLYYQKFKQQRSQQNYRSIQDLKSLQNKSPLNEFVYNEQPHHLQQVEYMKSQLAKKDKEIINKNKQLMDQDIQIQTLKKNSNFLQKMLTDKKKETKPTEYIDENQEIVIQLNTKIQELEKVIEEMQIKIYGTSVETNIESDPKQKMKDMEIQFKLVKNENNLLSEQLISQKQKLKKKRSQIQQLKCLLIDQKEIFQMISQIGEDNESMVRQLDCLMVQQRSPQEQQEKVESLKSSYNCSKKYEMLMNKYQGIQCQTQEIPPLVRTNSKLAYKSILKNTC